MFNYIWRRSNGEIRVLKKGLKWEFETWFFEHG